MEIQQHVQQSRTEGLELRSNEVTCPLRSNAFERLGVSVQKVLSPDLLCMTLLGSTCGVTVRLDSCRLVSVLHVESRIRIQRSLGQIFRSVGVDHRING
jgi:hypothetical protein